MAFIDGYEHDVFVSYAHADNEPLYDNDPDGWVTKFHRTLLSCLKRLDREKTVIWRDQRLRGNDVFDQVLEDAFRRAAVFVSILTPNYVQSEWCIRELRGFCPSSAPPQVGPKSRLFKVQPWDLPLERHPPEMSRLLGYKFYALKPDTQEEEPFRRTSQQDPDQRYWIAINNLARDISQVLDAMKAAPRGGGAGRPPVVVVPPAEAPAVYLADVTDDLLGSREEVSRSLGQAGLRVLPEEVLPPSAAEYAEAVRTQVRRARLSVHMFGSYYGRGPRGAERSYSRLQYDAACEVMREGGPPVLAWLKKGSEEQAEPLQQDFIDDLERGPGAAADSGPSVELFRVGLEELKESILARVRPPEPDPSDNPFFYISCLPDDSEKAQRFLMCLRHANYEGVVSPADDAAHEALLRKHHRANLRRCDVFVTMYGRAPEVWVSDKVLEANEVAKSRRKKRMTLTVFAMPDEKPLNVWVRNLRVWNAREDFGCEEVIRCLQEIRS